MLKVTRRTREVDVILNQQTAEDILRTLKGMPAIRSVEMHHPG